MDCPYFFRKPLVLIGTLFLGFSVSFLHAGSVLVLKDSSVTEGKVTFSPTVVHIDTGATPIDMNLDEILEADFSDVLFRVDCFSSVLDPDQLPLSWKEQDIGDSPTPGKMTYAKGTLTLTGSGSGLQRSENADQFYIVGQTWTGNGQFTARLNGINPPDAPAETGPMERDSVDPNAPMFAMGFSTGGGGLYLSRGKAGDHVAWTGFPAELPIWFRLTRQGETLDCETSVDGKKWDIMNMGGRAKTANPPWIGLFMNSRVDKAMATSTFDHLLLTPLPAEPGNLPLGILFRSGSFLAGGVDYLNPNGGMMSHAGKGFNIRPDQIAALIAHAVTPQDLASAGDKTGLIMRNGDFLESDLVNIQGTFFQASSVELGLITYYGDSIRAFTFHEVKPMSSNYELRLKDGSILRAKGFHQDQGQIAVDDVSGITIHVDPSEIAQLRAGSSRVQDLMDLPWKAKSPDESAPAAAVTAGAIRPAVETWQGQNQEQMIVARAGSSVDFPLTAKFSGLTLRVALSPDSPANAQAVLRVLADGHEVGRTPLIKGGDAPRIVSVKLQNPHALTFQVDSTEPNARLLIVDPVAIRSQ